MTYVELKKTELFSFFNFTENWRRPSRGGMQEIHFKPGGFQEFIDVKLKIDSSQMVHQGILYLDRAWIGGAMTVSPFGKDLAKSFIAAVTPDVDKAEADRVVCTIWNIQGSSDRVISIHPDCPEKIAEIYPIEELEHVYLGTADKFEMTFEKSCIRIENVMDVGRKRLKISIDSI